MRNNKRWRMGLFSWEKKAVAVWPTCSLVRTCRYDLYWSRHRWKRWSYEPCSVAGPQYCEAVFIIEVSEAHLVLLAQYGQAKCVLSFDLIIFSEGRRQKKQFSQPPVLNGAVVAQRLQKQACAWKAALRLPLKKLRKEDKWAALFCPWASILPQGPKARYQTCGQAV